MTREGGEPWGPFLSRPGAKQGGHKDGSKWGREMEARDDVENFGLTGHQASGQCTLKAGKPTMMTGTMRSTDRLFL